MKTIGKELLVIKLTFEVSFLLFQVRNPFSTWHNGCKVIKQNVILFYSSINFKDNDFNNERFIARV